MSNVVEILHEILGVLESWRGRKTLAQTTVFSSAVVPTFEACARIVAEYLEMLDYTAKASKTIDTESKVQQLVARIAEHSRSYWSKRLEATSIAASLKAAGDDYVLFAQAVTDLFHDANSETEGATVSSRLLNFLDDDRLHHRKRFPDRLPWYLISNCGGRIDLNAATAPQILKDPGILRAVCTAEYQRVQEKYTRVSIEFGQIKMRLLMQGISPPETPDKSIRPSFTTSRD